MVGTHRGKNVGFFPFTFPHLAPMQGLQSPAAVYEKIQGIKRTLEASPRMPEHTWGFSTDAINKRAPAEVHPKAGRPPGCRRTHDPHPQLRKLRAALENIGTELPKQHTEPLDPATHLLKSDLWSPANLQQWEAEDNSPQDAANPGWHNTWRGNDGEIGCWKTSPRNWVQILGGHQNTERKQMDIFSLGLSLPT